MVAKRKGNVSERLMKIADGKKKKLSKLQKEYEKDLFTPKISKKSRALALGKSQEALLKKDNGKTSNIDFFEAIEKGASSRTLAKSRLLRKKKSKRGYGKARDDEDREEPRNFDPVPNYLSPYNRELLSTDIPLKIIMKRTDQLNSNIGKKKWKKKTKRETGPAKEKGLKRENSVISTHSKKKSVSPLRRNLSKMRKSQNRSLRALNTQKKKEMVMTPSRKKKRKSKSPIRNQQFPIVRKSTQKWKRKKNEIALERRKQQFNEKEWNEQIRKKQRKTSQKRMKSLIYKDSKKASVNLFKAPADTKILDQSTDQIVRKSKQKFEKILQNENFEIPVKKQLNKNLGNAYMYQSIEMTKKKSNRHISPKIPKNGNISLFTQIR